MTIEEMREYQRNYWKTYYINNKKRLNEKARKRQKSNYISIKWIYGNRYIEAEPNQTDLFQTIEELKEWEKEHYPCINWTKWQEIVELTKEQLNQS